MTEHWLGAVVRWSIRGLLLLFLVGASRLLYVAWIGRAPQATGIAANVSEHGDTQASPQLAELYDSLTRGQPPAQSGHVAAVGSTDSMAPVTPRARFLQVYLVVNVAPDRSEVVVDGVTRGQTPYVGEVGCQSGSKMTVTVLPRKGAPKRFERECDRTEIRIDEATP